MEKKLTGRSKPVYKSHRDRSIQREREREGERGGEKESERGRENEREREGETEGERGNMHCQGIACTRLLDMGLTSAEGLKLVRSNEHQISISAC